MHQYQARPDATLNLRFNSRVVVLSVASGRCARDTLLVVAFS